MRTRRTATPAAHRRSARALIALTLPVLLLAGLVPGLERVPAAHAEAAPTPDTSQWKKPDLASAQIAARLGARRVEVESLTTETSKTYVEKNGSLTTEAAAAPLRVRRGEQWVDVDTTLELRDGKVRPRAAKGDLELSAGGTDPDGRTDLASLSAGTNSFALRWPGRLPAPTLGGDTATYTEVAPGVDVVVRALRDGFKDSIILKRPGSAPAGAKWRLPLKKGGLSAELRPDDAIVFRDSRGAQVALSAPTVMWDARRDPETGDPLVQAPVAPSW